MDRTKGAEFVLVHVYESFYLTLTLNVFVNDAPHFHRRWYQSTKRRLIELIAENENRESS